MMNKLNMIIKSKNKKYMFISDKPLNRRLEWMAH